MEINFFIILKFNDKKIIVYWYYKCYVVFKMDGEEKNIYLNGVEIVNIS